MNFVFSASIAGVLTALLVKLRRRCLDGEKYGKTVVNAAFAFVLALIWSDTAVAVDELQSMLPRPVAFRALLYLAFFIAAYLLLDRDGGRAAVLCARFGRRFTDRKALAAGAAAVLIPTVLFCIILSLRTMPIAEGWYSVYAKLINDRGAVPYRDFELLFMPLYTYLIAGITSVFGYDIITLRIFGVILYAVITLLTYGIFRRLFKPWIASVATIVTALFMQSEIVQIFYDYIRVFDALTYAATLLLISYTAKVLSGPRPSAFSWRIVLSGMLASFSFLVRQSSGAFVVAYTVLLLLFLVVYCKNKGRHIAVLAEYLVAAVVPIVFTILFMQSKGCLDSFLHSTVSGAINSKGGIMTVLFGWIPNALRCATGNIRLLGLVAASLGFNYFLYRKYPDEKNLRRGGIAVSVLFFVAVTAGVFICFANDGISDAFAAMKSMYTTYVMFAVTTVVFTVTLIWLFRHKNAPTETVRWAGLLMTLSGMVVAIGYGVGTSSGLSEGQTALAVGLTVALMLHFSGHIFGNISRVLTLAVSVALCLTIISSKYITPYSWWGLYEERLSSATETINGVDYLGGIKVSESTNDGIRQVVRAIKQHSDKNDSIFVTPHAPIFYLLSDRYPDTYTIVQWFDVASDSAVEADIDRLRENKPKVIVHVRVPDEVVKSHEDLFRSKQKSGYRKLSEALDDMEMREGYRLCTDVELQGYQVEVYCLD